MLISRIMKSLKQQLNSLGVGYVSHHLWWIDVIGTTKAPPNAIGGNGLAGQPNGLIRVWVPQADG